MNLFVDDLRLCPKGFIHAKDYDEAVIILKKNKINILSLDHDLGEGKSGYDIAKFIVEAGIENPLIWPNEIYLHTDNPVGRKNMY